LIFILPNKFDEADIDELMKWDEEIFLKKTEGPPISRKGFQRTT